MQGQPNIAKVSALIGDTARSKMLLALLSGKALTVGELANEADITLPTASSHLSKLLEGQLLCVRKQGRHKYFQLQGAEVASLLESLLVLSAKGGIPNIATGPHDSELRRARVCYDHLAGEISVGLFDALAVAGLVVVAGEQLGLSQEGEKFFTGIGADLQSMKKGKRPLCKTCLDWSERRFHVAGSLGQWILSDLLNRNWAQQSPDSRVVKFTGKGLIQFRQRYGINSR